MIYLQVITGPRLCILIFISILFFLTPYHLLKSLTSGSTSNNNNKSTSSSSSKITMNNSIYRAVLVTVPTLEIGKKIAEGIIKNKLGACVNIIPQITSIYEWEGKLTEDSELLLIIKTQATHFEQLSKFVQENHPYDTPEVISLPIDQGSQSYLDWIKSATTTNK